ncbi:hypothetical protein FBU30_005606 [Linnemannia zychae]|nr:hypothetical protein FBU30_005606 [Linnemannia zychae]
MLSEGPDSRTLHIWDQLNNSPRHILKHDKGINSSAWSHCEKWFATGCEGLVFLWHITPDEPIGNRFYTLAITELIGVVGSIAWKPDALEFVVCCHDGSARAWRLVEISGIWSAQLVWRSGNSTLAVSGARFSEAIGLSATNRRLLEQRSQDIEPLSGLDNVHK